MKRLIINLLHRHGWYRIDDLVIGGNCGLCGAWIPNQIFEAWWTWGICDKCVEESESE